MLIYSFVAGFFYGFVLLAVSKHSKNTVNNDHWSKQRWWTERHTHRYDDLQEKDRPHLFD